MLDFGTLPTLVTTVAIVLGVLVGLRELRHFSKVRSADVIRGIGDRSANPEALESFFMIQRMQYKSYD